MKKNILINVISVIVVLSLGILVFVALINKSEFDYKEAKKKTEEFLSKNEKQLTKLVNELYESKTFKKGSIKGISYASYVDRDDFDFKNEIEYIKIDLDSQGNIMD